VEAWIARCEQPTSNRKRRTSRTLRIVCRSDIRALSPHRDDDRRIVTTTHAAASAQAPGTGAQALRNRCPSAPESVPRSGRNRCPSAAGISGQVRAEYASTANGKTEAWIADRTGHTTSAMINRYRRAARTHSELGQGRSHRSTWRSDCPSNAPCSFRPGLPRAIPHRKRRDDHDHACAPKCVRAF
jgi:hypothetical protein